MTYQWIHPPIKLVDGVGRPGPGLCVQDDLNQASVLLQSEHVPDEDHRMYALEAYKPGEDIEEVHGFFLSRDADLSDPQPADVFVSMKDNSVYLPIGQHSSGSHHPGDWLISIEDYEAISRGLYTPAVYTCAAVRDWDPHKQIRSWR